MDKFRTQLNYGSAAGTLAFVFFVLYGYFGLNPIGNMSWFSSWIPVLFIILAIRKIRDTELEGYITYKKGLSIGILTSLVYASLFGMMIYIYGTFIDSSFLELYKNEAFDGMELMEKYLDDSTMDLMIKEIDSITIGRTAISDFQTKLVGGIICSLIIAGFLKRERPIFDEI